MKNLKPGCRVELLDNALELHSERIDSSDYSATCNEWRKQVKLLLGKALLVAERQPFTKKDILYLLAPSDTLSSSSPDKPKDGSKTYTIPVYYWMIKVLEN